MFRAARLMLAFACLPLGVVLFAVCGLSASEPPEFAKRVRQAVERALPLLEIASAGTAESRKCFTCHGQAMPSVVLAKAQTRGFHIDEKNLQRQLEHTYAHLKRSKRQYADGKGTGGQVDTAGWALWGLEAGESEPDSVTDPVIEYLLSKQKPSGVWPCSSDRPPSEKSDFATSYLALRGLEMFGREPHAVGIAEAKAGAVKWLAEAEPADTEDRVFQLLSLPYVDLYEQTDRRVSELLQQQRKDGGWGQLPEMESDPYATATVLYALADYGMEATNPTYQRGMEYLLEQQLEDGSWHVRSRSKPFQVYFESGYPHGQDQFISTTAACWASLALMHALPEESP